ncbi:MAG: GtrA-like protein [Verrucomicrobia bacterium ADurb.Bin345]|nr:MAG: GtrA-like protein [Verrucomicrobia bacterium ADurb.Bin345]
MQRDASPGVQFIKYAIAGGIATSVDMLVFYILSWKVFPALRPDDPISQLIGLFGFTVTPITEAVRAQNYVINRCITFLFSNFAAYIVNIYWVFEPGRHKKWVEISLFYAVSLTSYVIGTTVGWAIIKALGLSTTFAYIANVIASLLINYACRKYIVFKK